MAVNYGPSTIRSGLVMHFDMANRQKSWKGQPTTNITPNLGIVQVQSVSCTYVGLEDGWKKYALNGTWTAGTYPYAFAVDSFTCTGGVTYSAGVYIKTNVASKFAALFTGMNYVNQPMNNVGTSFSILQPDGSIFVGRYGFQYTSTTGQNGYLISQPIINQVFNAATDFLYIKDGQIEQNVVCTPFVAGTRSNTQAILDLTGTNTITATSLTYNSDGTFSFNGSNNYLETANNIITGNSPFTFECFYTLSGQTGGEIFGNYGSGYSSANYIWISGQYGLYIGGAVYFPGAPIANGTYHMACSRDTSGNCILYKNGIQVNSGTLTGSIAAGPNFRIGIDTGGTGEPFSGKIYSQRLYNRVLSASEVAQNFNAQRGIYGL